MRRQQWWYTFERRVTGEDDPTVYFTWRSPRSPARPPPLHWARARHQFCARPGAFTSMGSSENLYCAREARSGWGRGQTLGEGGGGEERRAALFGGPARTRSVVPSEARDAARIDRGTERSAGLRGARAVATHRALHLVLPPVLVRLRGLVPVFLPARIGAGGGERQRRARPLGLVVLGTRARGRMDSPAMAHTHTSSHFACVRTMCDSNSACRFAGSSILLARKRVSHPMAVACGRAGRRGARCGVAERAGGVGGASSSLAGDFSADTSAARAETAPPSAVSGSLFPGLVGDAQSRSRARLLEALGRALARFANPPGPGASVRAGLGGRGGGAKVRGAGCRRDVWVPSFRRSLARCLPEGRRRTRRLARRPPRRRRPPRPLPRRPPSRSTTPPPASRNARSTPPRAPAASSTPTRPPTASPTRDWPRSRISAAPRRRGRATSARTSHCSETS